MLSRLVELKVQADDLVTVRRLVVIAYNGYKRSLWAPGDRLRRRLKRSEVGDHSSASGRIGLHLLV